MKIVVFFYLFCLKQFANFFVCVIPSFRFEVEFSKPEKTAPIPEGTVKIYFTVIPTTIFNTNDEKPIIEGKDEDQYTVEFNFENESLKHQLSNTMR